MTEIAPIFQSIFGEQWACLPPVMRKHYANRPSSQDIVTVEGLMKVEISLFAKLLRPLFRLSGALVPYEGENIPVTIYFRSEPHSSAYCFDRIFHFPNKRPYHFRSRMVPVGENQVVDYMSIGIGWNASYRYDGKKILIEHQAYKVKLFGKLVRFPLELLLGRASAEEEAVSEDRFCMNLHIQHPLFGRVYAYSGEFFIKEVALND